MARPPVSGLPVVAAAAIAAVFTEVDCSAADAARAICSAAKGSLLLPPLSAATAAPANAAACANCAPGVAEGGSREGSGVALGEGWVLGVDEDVPLGLPVGVGEGVGVVVLLSVAAAVAVVEGVGDGESGGVPDPVPVALGGAP